MKKMMIMAAACMMAAMSFAAQCAAKTEDGVQCKRQAEENSKYCWQHLKGATQCQALTKDGDKCKRKAQPGKKYCWQHAEYKPTAKTEAKKPAAKTEAKKPAAKKGEAKKGEAKKPEAKPAAKGAAK